MKYLIIGGVAGGATAAARIRRIDENAQIILFEKGKYISYANCGLPYYIGGTIGRRDRLFVQTSEAFAQRFKVDVRTESLVTRINVGSKSIEIMRKDGSNYTETYDKLLMSPGANAVKPPLEGIDLEGIFTLRNVDDTDRIKGYISNHNIKSAVVVGAGFIGLEMAENLHNAGASVSIVEMGSQVMAPVDFSIASHVHHHLIQNGVNLYLNEGVERFEELRENQEINNGCHKKITVYFKSGKSITTDMVILSIGVRPETTLAKEAGLRIGEAGGIWVDEYLQTSDSNIYAVGDAIEFPHPISKKPWLNLLANPANRQGRIVADNIVFGNRVKYEGAIGTSIAKVFDITVASTGLAAKRLKQLGIKYQSSTTHSLSHAGYYPDSLSITLKITFDPETGKLFGAQCVGYDGVDKRIDQIALLIKMGGSIYDLMQIEHAYAPPFSSAKDPIAIAGYVANNIINGAMPIITWRELLNTKSEVVLLDVRTKEENLFGAIAGSVNIPLDELRERIGELTPDKNIVVYCAIGLRGYLAMQILSANGFKNVRNLSGGYKTYSTATEKLINGAGKGENRSNSSSSNLENNTAQPIKIDACGLQCPGPIMIIKKKFDTINTGDRVEIVATDAGFSRDAQAWCNTTGNILISNRENNGKYTVLIEKGEKKDCTVQNGTYKQSNKTTPLANDDCKSSTFIMFSDSLDKTLATFVLANGALAAGKKVTIFFTFWGLNVIKKVRKPNVSKDIFGKMFGMMLSSSSLKLHLSKMSMFGLGDKMMRYIMRKKGIESLENLMQQALDNGAEFIACQMSMDVMGIKREELIDNISIGGVATYIEKAENANSNLFI